MAFILRGGLILTIVSTDFALGIATHHDRNSVKSLVEALFGHHDGSTEIRSETRDSDGNSRLDPSVHPNILCQGCPTQQQQQPTWLESMTSTPQRTSSACAKQNASNTAEEAFGVASCTPSSPLIHNELAGVGRSPAEDEGESMPLTRDSYSSTLEPETNQHQFNNKKPISSSQGSRPRKKTYVASDRVLRSSRKPPSQSCDDHGDCGQKDKNPSRKQELHICVRKSAERVRKGFKQHVIFRDTSIESRQSFQSAGSSALKRISRRHRSCQPLPMCSSNKPLETSHHSEQTYTEECSDCIQPQLQKCDTIEIDSYDLPVLKHEVARSSYSHTNDCATTVEALKLLTDISNRIREGAELRKDTSMLIREDVERRITTEMSIAWQCLSGSILTSLTSKMRSSIVGVEGEGGERNGDAGALSLKATKALQDVLASYSQLSVQMDENSILVATAAHLIDRTVGECLNLLYPPELAVIMLRGQKKFSGRRKLSTIEAIPQSLYVNVYEAIIALQRPPERPAFVKADTIVGTNCATRIKRLSRLPSHRISNPTLQLIRFLCNILDESITRLVQVRGAAGTRAELNGIITDCQVWLTKVRRRDSQFVKACQKRVKRTVDHLIALSSISAQE